MSTSGLRLCRLSRPTNQKATPSTENVPDKTVLLSSRRPREGWRLVETETTTLDCWVAWDASSAAVYDQPSSVAQPTSLPILRS